MGKNRIVAKNTRAGSNLATGRDYAADKAYQSTEKRKEYRADLNRINNDNPNSRVGDGKDVSHKKGGGTVLEPQAANRARNRGKK